MGVVIFANIIETAVTAGTAGTAHLLWAIPMGCPNV